MDSKNQTEPAVLTWDPVEGAQGYELNVYDRTDARIVLEETVTEPAHEAPIPSELRNHDLVMRARPLHGDRWGEWTEFRPLPLEFVLGERRETLPPASEHDELGLLLMFTIDTECSVLRQPTPDPERVVDELIFGDFGNGARPGGIGLQMDLLEHFGFRGTFFVDVLMEFEHGRRALERTIEAIAERGHEVELHIHPEHLEWSSDPWATSVAAELRGEGMRRGDVFRRVLELSVDLFERRVGRQPVAYRAGAYRISDAHFPVLEELGIRIDSSVQPYFNSRVSDWMRTRTQPYWVGGVLEIPPTFVLLGDDPDAWATRALVPSFGLGDPISALSAEPGGPPSVATLVSHSFQLLRCRDSQAREAVESFEARMRAGLPGDVADRMLRQPLKAMRTFGEEVDEGHAAHVAGLLRRVADRPDARCVTYSEVASLVDRLWPSERFPAVDRIALLDRRRGVATTTGTRVFSRGLLERLGGEGPTNPPSPVSEGDSDWLLEAEAGGVDRLEERIDAAAADLDPERPLRLRLRTLGVAAPQHRGALPPLAEILFPVAAVRAVGEGFGADLGDPVPWDVSTFRGWLHSCGFEVLSERRLPRGSIEMEALERFGEKLRFLDPVELRTAAWEVELRRTRPPQPRRGSNDSPLAAAELYESLHPGQETSFAIDASQPASRTTLLLALMRAGLEILEWEGSAYRVIRPVDLPDIRRFAGVE